MSTSHLPSAPASGSLQYSEELRDKSSVSPEDQKPSPRGNIQDTMEITVPRNELIPEKRSTAPSEITTKSISDLHHLNPARADDTTGCRDQLWSSHRRCPGVVSYQIYMDCCVVPFDTGHLCLDR